MRLRRTVRALAGAVGIALIAPPLPAQELVLNTPAASTTPDSIELVDRIVAIVGDTAILLSEIKEGMIRMQAQGMSVPPPGSPEWDTIARQLLEQLIDQMVLLNRAVAAGVTIPPEQIDEETERRFREVRNSFPSAAEFQETVVASGLNLFQYRELLREQVRAEYLIQTFVRQNEERLPPVSVSEDEIRAYFEANAAGQVRPATVTFEQLVIRPTASPEARDSAIALADSAIREIRTGTDFEIVARRYSQDPNSRDEGGDIGWLRRSDLDSKFAAAAWAANPGDIVGPVETIFGFHVIRVERVRGAERQIRHILIIPKVNASDVTLARELATALADSIRAGAVVTTLAERYGAEEELVRHDGVPVVELGERYGRPYQEALAPDILAVAEVETVIGPFEAEALRGQHPVFVVVKVLRYLPEGDYELEDVWDNIRSGLMEQKRFARFVEEMKNEVYVENLY